MKNNTSYKAQNGKTFNLLEPRYTIMGESHVTLSDNKTIICISEKKLSETFTKNE